ncbi:hypothetical protein ACTFIZ_002658 [Dictyostelium cf. discoideum]
MTVINELSPQFENLIDSLELLSQSFLDIQVRNFTIQNLCKMNDDVSSKINSIPNNRRKDYLIQALGGGNNNNNNDLLNYQEDFKTPINPEFRGKRIDVSGCKVKESKTLPLFLSIENYDPMGGNSFVIFKACDDLRQDSNDDFFQPLATPIKKRIRRIRRRRRSSSSRRSRRRRREDQENSKPFKEILLEIESTISHYEKENESLLQINNNYFQLFLDNITIANQNNRKIKQMESVLNEFKGYFKLFK